MKVLIDRARLVKALSALAPLTKGASLNPLGEGVFIKATGNKVLFRATSIEQTMEWEIEALVEIEGEVVIPLLNLLSLVKNVTEEEVVLETKGAGVECQYGKKRATFSAYKTDDFPLLPSAGEETVITVEADDIRTAISEVAYAAAGKNPLKPITTGISFSVFEEVVLLACDGYRLARSQTKNAKIINGTGEYIVPGKAVKTLGSLEGEIRVSFSQSFAKFETEECNLIAQLLVGEFPQVEEHIPTNFQTKVALQKELLIQSLKRVLAFDPSIIDIEVNGKVMLRAESESGNIEEDVAGKIEGDVVRGLFSPRFALEAAVSAPEEIISVGFAGNNLPMVMETEGKEKFCALILPIMRENAQ